MTCCFKTLTTAAMISPTAAAGKQKQPRHWRIKSWHYYIRQGGYASSGLGKAKYWRNIITTTYSKSWTSLLPQSPLTETLGSHTLLSATSVQVTRSWNAPLDLMPAVGIMCGKLWPLWQVIETRKHGSAGVGDIDIGVTGVFISWEGIRSS